MNPIEITDDEDLKKPSKKIFEITMLKIIKNFKILRTYVNFYLEKSKFLNTQKFFYRFLNFSKNINRLAFCSMTIRKIMNSLSAKKLTFTNLVYIKFFKIQKLTKVFYDEIKKIINYKKAREIFSLVKFNLKSGEVEMFLWIFEQYWLEKIFCEKFNYNANDVNSFILIEQRNKHFFYYELQKIFIEKAFTSYFEKNFSWYNKKRHFNLYNNKIHNNIEIFPTNNLGIKIKTSKKINKKTSNDVFIKSERLISYKNVKKVFLSFVETFISFSISRLRKRKKRYIKYFFFFENFSFYFLNIFFWNFFTLKKKNQKIFFKKNNYYLKSIFFIKYPCFFPLNKIKNIISLIVSSYFNSILPDNFFFCYYGKGRERLNIKIFANRNKKNRRLIVKSRVF